MIRLSYTKQYTSQYTRSKSKGDFRTLNWTQLDSLDLREEIMRRIERIATFHGIAQHSPHSQ
jgi:hypothetical protein